ncbi:MAG: hypothetical protein JRD88_05360 [Deltaproteobacteria bacterium]|jgi:hypothetical protein|nr:hypothetical protein [Deltaproteobacteria bacterium]
MVTNRKKHAVKRRHLIMSVAVIAIFMFPMTSLAAQGEPGRPGGEEAGNNLSFPVIWAEGVTKALPGSAGMEPTTNGEWWYWWGTTGTDPNIEPLSCPPDPDDSSLCDDGIPDQTTGDRPGTGWVKAYLQKDPGNIWQAATIDWIVSGTNYNSSSLVVDWIDWGDNLESVDWYTKSKVRTEVVLYQDMDPPLMPEYQMQHVSGWGKNEVHGLAVDQSGNAMLGTGEQATVYSPCARLTIQKLLVDRDDPATGEPNPVLESMVWDDFDKVWSGEGLVNPPIFNKAVWAAGDGPDYYSAEINVKGKIIYGYTWDVRKLNDFIVNEGDASGDYRITFSFDDTCGTAVLNTFFVPASAETGDPGTQLLLPIEEEEEISILEEDEGRYRRRECRYRL